MRKIRLSKSFLTAALVICSLAGCRNRQAPDKNVWAVVNGTQIQRSEVEKYYRSQLQSEGATPSADDSVALKLKILDQLINNEILFQQARALNLVASDADVEQKFTQSKSPFTEDEFQKKLQENGLTVSDLKQEIRRELSIQKLLNREVVSKITISSEDITDFYNKNRAQFNVAEPQYHVAQIVVSPGPNPQLHNRLNDDAGNTAAANKKVATIEARLAGGADFTQMAVDYSEDANSANGGDLGFIPLSSLNQTDPALKNTVLALKPGEVSKPVLLKDGYHIIKLIAREPAGQRQVSDPQVQQSIRSNLQSRREQLLRAAYLTSLRDHARVMNYLAKEVLESAGKLPADLAQK